MVISINMIWRFKLIIFILFVLMHFNSIAQNVSSVTDFKVIHTINNNTTFHIPNQPLFFQSNKTTNTQFSILHSADEYFQLSATVFSVKGKLFAFGQEQVFNSDDTTGLNSNELVWLKEIVNKPKTIEVKQFHAVQSPIKTNQFFEIEQEDAGKYFLPFASSIVKAGLSWSDSTMSDSSKSVHQYLILKVQDNQATVSVFSDLMIKTSFKQAGQMIQQNLKGIARAERIYDLNAAKMLSESVLTKLSGSSNNGTDIIPLTIELKATSVVSWK
jgi:hypothetical protein